MLFRSIATTGKFSYNPSAGYEKQFGFSYDETAKFGNWIGQTDIVTCRIPSRILSHYFTLGLDTGIFFSGTLSVGPDQLQGFNELVKGTIQIIP